MSRYLIDITKLPTHKADFLKNLLINYTTSEQSKLLRSLIHLGYITAKQSDVDASKAMIGFSDELESLKIRVNLIDTPVEKSLDQFDSKKYKRSAVYAFLFAGVTYFLNSLEKLNHQPNGNNDHNQIEKNLFLSGLSGFISTTKVFTINKPEVKKVKTINQSIKSKSNIKPSRNADFVESSLKQDEDLSDKSNEMGNTYTEDKSSIRKKIPSILNSIKIDAG